MGVEQQSYFGPALVPEVVAMPSFIRQNKRESCQMEV